MSRETQQATEIICLQFSEEFLNQNGEFDIDEIVDEISTVTELIQVKNQYALEIKPEHLNDNIGDNTDENTDETTEPNFNPEDCIAIIEIPSQPISDALNPAIQEAKNYLISSYGFSNQEINEMIEDENGKEEDLVPLVMAMTNAENSNNGIVFNYMSIFGESVYAQDWEQIGNCAMVAIGADVLYALATVNPAQGSKWKKKAIKKAFGAVAKRMLGPIGVAIAVVSFAMCMGGL